MTIKDYEILQIVTRASSLSERFSVISNTTNATEIIEPQNNHSVWQDWCQVVAQGNWSKFHKRLNWDELNIIQAKSALTSLPDLDRQALPIWAQTLQAIVQMGTSFGDRNLETKANQAFSSQMGKVLPFTELLLPALFVARKNLLTRLGSPGLNPDSLPLEVLSDTAYLNLERSLLYRLLNISGKTWEYEFARSRPLGHKLLNLLYLLNQSEKATPDRTEIQLQYNTFVREILADGLLTFFQKYPVLAKLIATAVDFWVEATAEFIQRLQSDIPEIQRIFQKDAEQLGKAIEIEPSLSDPHNLGKTVISLKFESGLKLVYKPKSLGIEVAYTEFLNWCNHQGVPLLFKVLKVCDRQTYGWVEYVEHLPCQDEEAVERFYRRSGMLLCLLYALRVVDCHRENLIASGEHLVLIDMETLMHQEVNPIAELPEATEAETSVGLQFADSVLRTGLLPRWEFSKNNRLAVDNSALGSIEPESGNQIPANVPILNGQPLSPDRYLDFIVNGFEEMYRFLIEKRALLLGSDSPLVQMQNQRVRFIFRATRIYWSILQKSFQPQFFRDGVERSIQLEILSRAFLIAPQKPDAWPIFHAEMKAMEQLDIPYFAANPNSSQLSFGLEKPIENYFKQPSYQETLNQISNLNETDLAQQIEIIKGSFYARVTRTPASDDRQLFSHPSNDARISPLTQVELLAEATRIATEIQDRAIVGTDGSIKWISFAYIPNAERFQLMPLPEYLYNGNSGIALFLAALDYVRGSNQFRDLALGSLRSIRQFLQTADFESTRRFVRCGLGGGTGMGSIVYALTTIGRFLPEPTVIEDALGIANLITAEIIASDRQFDTIGGASGAILGLLALYAQTKDAKVLDTAAMCGQHLLAHRTSINNAPKAWKILGQKQYTGFSHGAAGIAYALLRLYEATKETAYLEAAKEAIAYENSVFSEIAANWPDFRDFAQKNGQPGFMVSWCHGATGIGLGRLGSRSIFNAQEIDRDVEVAVRTTLNHTLQDVDSVCCGNFGRIELLLVAALELSRPELRLAAEQKAAWGIHRAQKAGGYLFPNLPNSVFSPSFFQGTSGIGYELLRLAYPEKLPSVLLWHY